MGGDVELGAVFLDVAICGMYDEGMILVLCHDEVGLTHESHLTQVALEGEGIGESGVAVEVYASAIGECHPKLLVVSGGERAFHVLIHVLLGDGLEEGGEGAHLLRLLVAHL